MSGGELALTGAPEAVFSDTELLNGYGLAAPAFVELRESLKAAGMPIPGNPMDCDGISEAIWQSLSNK